MSAAETVAKLRLIRSENIGPVTYRQLVMRFGNAVAAVDALPDLARRGGRNFRIATIDEAEAEIAAITGFGGQLLFIGSDFYPHLLIFSNVHDYLFGS